MNGRDLPRAIPHAAASRQYLVLSLAALAVILLVLLDWGMGRWSFLPILIGLLGVTLRWRITPLLTLILLAGLLLASEVTDRAALLRHAARGFSLSNWLLCGAALALCAAHYRVQGLTASPFPADRRRNDPLGKAADGPGGLSGMGRPRSPRSVSPFEIGWLVLSVPVWAFLAQLCWRLLPTGGRVYGLTPQTWRGIVLAWMLVPGLLTVAGLLSYAAQRRLRESEARLFLQDAFWQETGREQRRLNRWLAWARLRRRRRKEKR